MLRAEISAFASVSFLNLSSAACLSLVLLSASIWVVSATTCSLDLPRASPTLIRLLSEVGIASSSSFLRVILFSCSASCSLTSASPVLTSVNALSKPDGILSNKVSPNNVVAAVLISSRLVPLCPFKLLARPLAVVISVSATSAAFFALSSSAFVGAITDKKAGAGCSVEPQTGQGCPSFSSTANIPACSSRYALFRVSYPSRLVFAIVDFSA